MGQRTRIHRLRGHPRLQERLRGHCAQFQKVGSTRRHGHDPLPQRHGPSAVGRQQLQYRNAGLLGGNAPLGEPTARARGLRMAPQRLLHHRPVGVQADLRHIRPAGVLYGRRPVRILPGNHPAAAKSLFPRTVRHGNAESCRTQECSPDAGTG